MPNITIVGAGQGLGLAIARIFGREGFSVALISRNRGNLDTLVATLGDEGVGASGFVADVRDHDGVRGAITQVQERFGEIDVLEYSPAMHTPSPGFEIVAAPDLTVAAVQPQIDFFLHGAIVATQAVLPGMVERGRGTLLYTTGASSVHPSPVLGNIGPAGAALRNWVLSLHPALAPQGIHVGHVPIAVFLGSGGPETQPEAVAPIYWDLHERRDEVERQYGTMPASLLGG